MTEKNGRIVKINLHSLTHLVFSAVRDDTFMDFTINVSLLMELKN